MNGFYIIVKEAKQASADIASVLNPGAGGRLVINEPDFTACRMSPLSFDLNIAYNIHYNRTMAYGHIGGELHTLTYHEFIKTAYIILGVTILSQMRCLMGSIYCDKS